MKFYINIVIMFSLYSILHQTNGHSDLGRYRCDYKFGARVMGWFKFHLVPASWHDARLICTSEGSMLVSPVTKEMRDEMRTFFITKSRIFTGLHTTYSKGKYFTVDGIPLDAIPHKWEHHEPDNKNNNENCLAMNDGGLLSDVNCGRPLPFICFRKEAAEITQCGTHDTSYVHDIRTNQCYKFHTTPRNFSRAFLVCSAEGGHLAIVNSDAEAQVIVDLFSNYPATSMIGPFWKDVALIGIVTRQEGGDWRTIHGKTLREAGYDKWSPGEPNNVGGAEFCGSISRRGLLYDSSCVKEYAFICEKTPDYPPYCRYSTTKGIPTTTSKWPIISPSNSDFEPSTNPSDSDFEPTISPSDSDFEETTNPSDNDLEPSTNPSDSDFEPTISPSGSDFEPSTNPSDSDFELTISPSGSDFGPSTNPSDSDFEATINPSDSDFEPTISPSDISPSGSDFGPSTNPSDSDFEATINPSDSDFEPTISPSDNDFEATINPSDSDFEPTISPSDSDFGPSISPSDIDFEPTISTSDSDFGPSTNPSDSDFEPTISPSDSDFEETTNPSDNDLEPSTNPSDSDFEPTTSPTELPTTTSKPPTTTMSKALKAKLQKLENCLTKYYHKPLLFWKPKSEARKKAKKFINALIKKYENTKNLENRVNEELKKYVIYC